MVADAAQLLAGVVAATPGVTVPAGEVSYLDVGGCFGDEAAFEKSSAMSLRRAVELKLVGAIPHPTMDFPYKLLLRFGLQVSIQKLEQARNKFALSFDAPCDGNVIHIGAH